MSDKIWTRGDDFRESADNYMTYGITRGAHENAIEVYTSAEDRDYILNLLIVRDRMRPPTCYEFNPPVPKRANRRQVFSASELDNAKEDALEDAYDEMYPESSYKNRNRLRIRAKEILLNRLTAEIHKIVENWEPLI